MATTLVQPCGSCACGGPAIGTITCVSRQGNATLRGWSKAANFNSGDWNARKCKRLGFSKSVEEVCYDLNILDCAAYEGWTGWMLRILGEPTALWNVTTNVIAQSAEVRRQWSCSAPATYDLFPSGQRYLSELVHSYWCSDAYSYATGYSQAAVSDYLYRTTFNARSSGSNNSSSIGSPPDAGCDLCTPGEIDAGATLYQTTRYFAAHNADCTLSDFDSVADAHARASVSPGSDCRTTAGTSITSTTAGTTSAIAVTGPQSVEATIPITGLTVSTNYIVTVKIARYTAGGGSYVDFVYDTIDFTAGASTEDITYDVPVNTDYDYEIDTSYKDIAAA